ncbi:MAG: efflux RND transporter periplasmic adaptor subunit, partial [Candidatus Falkowbacteria bacterium]|nr:efflux RND transporter periplasmic adaptor subunit [Candidatus Falkowbacteria bacterium]
MKHFISVLSKATEALQLTKTLSHNLYTLLLNTTTSSDLSQTSLDSLKSSASSNESSSISGISSVQSAIQSIASAKLKISSSQLSSSGSMGSAQTALEKAKTTLATAKRNLEQVKADNATNLYSTQNDIASRKISYESAQAQYNLKIAKPRSVDLVSLRIQVSQAQTSYTDTLKNLKEAEILAPFDGIIIQVNGKEGDAASPVNSILTLGTQKKLATITLNEIDIVKIKSGQKSTITFSAIDGLSLTGEVAEVDNLGVVSQSVVTYTVKIVFDTDDERIKPQMSVSASIITNQSLDALVVPNSAIKQDNSGKSYVETLSAPEPIASSNQVTSKIAPDKKYVQTGLADDSQTEVVSGLNEGDQIITATVNTTQATTKPATTSGLNLLGGGG